MWFYMLQTKNLVPQVSPLFRRCRKGNRIDASNLHGKEITAIETAMLWALTESWTYSSPPFWQNFHHFQKSTLWQCAHPSRWRISGNVAECRIEVEIYLKVWENDNWTVSASLFAAAAFSSALHHCVDVGFPTCSACCGNRAGCFAAPGWFVLTSHRLLSYGWSGSRTVYVFAASAVQNG